jgi:hypothetical protein
MARRYFAWALLLLTGVSTSAFGQRANTDEHDVEPQLTANDRADTWNLHFRFQTPRILVEDVKGRGKRTIWYMPYSVYNLDPKDTPRTFQPDIELVTLDRHTRHADEVLPSVFDKIVKREDPTGRFDFKSPVSIAKSEIPVSKADSYPRVVHGVAIWTEVDPAPGSKDKTPKTNKFSIFVAGLSNSYIEERPTDQPGVRIIKRKTLQLDFERLGDGETIEPSGIRWRGNPAWIYRASTEPIKERVTPAPEPVKEKEDPKSDR